MQKKETGPSQQGENLKAEVLSALAAFEREMTEHTIPEIVRAVEKRRLLAAESRQRQLELPADQRPEPDA